VQPRVRAGVRRIARPAHRRRHAPPGSAQDRRAAERARAVAPARGPVARPRGRAADARAQPVRHPAGRTPPNPSDCCRRNG
jgi:hypothetical protein